MFAKRSNWNLAPNRLSEALARHRATARRLFDLTASNPTECGFDYNSAAILRALQTPVSLLYEPHPKGLEVSRRAVAQYYVDRGSRVSIDDIILTTSTSEAYSYIFRALCDPGDEILVPAPSYPLFGFLADIQDVELVRYPLLYDHGWHIDFHALRQAITSRTRAVVVVNPNNPTGHFAKPAEQKQLNEICRVRGLAIIADEVFLDFALGSSKPISFAANSEALTFTLSGLSKISGLPQMKIAWLVTAGPDDLKQQALARLEIIADTYLSMNAPIQHAALEFFQQRHGFQKQLIARLQDNLKELDSQLGAKTCCNRLEIEGGWYGVLRIPATCSDEDQAIKLLEHQDVYVHPGHFYDFSRDEYLVLSLIVREQEFAEGITRLLAGL